MNDDRRRMNDEWCVCVCVVRSGTGVIEDAAAWEEWRNKNNNFGGMYYIKTHVVMDMCGSKNIVHYIVGSNPLNSESILSKPN